MNEMNNSTNLKFKHREYNFVSGNFLSSQVKKKKKIADKERKIHFLIIYTYMF